MITLLVLVAGAFVLAASARHASPHTAKTMRRTSAIALSIVGAIFMLYGPFACTYQGDGGSGETYVTLAGHRLDAAIAGLLALLTGFAAFWFAVRILRRR